MSMVLAIARRELREYAFSPVAWAVLALFAVIAGVSYSSALSSFLDETSQAQLLQPDQPINVTQLLVRPFFLKVAVTVLFVLPVAIAGVFARVRRSDVVAAATDWQVVMGTFLGALAFYASTLLVTLVDVGSLFAYGRPEWQWIAAGYLGLLLMGGTFISLALLLSSIARDRIVAVVLTLTLSLTLWAVAEVAAIAPPALRLALLDLSLLGRFDDFARGIIDTGSLFYYLSVTVFAFVLTVAALGAWHESAPGSRPSGERVQP